MSFRIHEPAAEPTPLVVEVPHAGLYVDPVALASLAAPAYSLARDADLYVDELYADAPALGATLLVAEVSRYVCDLNRGDADFDSATVEHGGSRPAPHGLIWRSTTENHPALTARLSREELERRLETYYRPYHAALERLLAQKRERFGFSVLLAAHSMPSRGRSGHADPGHERADVVPGSRGRTTAGAFVIEAAEGAALELGLSVVHDEPYRGGYTTGHHGRPAAGSHALQIELARRLYMDEVSLEKKPRYFEETAEFCRLLVERLGALRP